MSRAPAHDVYVCPHCRSPLGVGPAALTCALCGRSYPVEDGIPDFLEGARYDRFAADHPRRPEAELGLHYEDAGAADRIARFYLPRIEARRRPRAGKVGGPCGPPAPPGDAFRVLDCGCGSGLSVDLLNDAGMDAWGNDPSSLRRWQWRERRRRDRLFLADGGRLPVPDGFFDVVLASGVLEHVGVTEERDAGYRVRPLDSRDSDRLAFLAELLRVTSPGGAIWLDFPNGAFPIDFWHGDAPGGARFHSLGERFLPTASEIRGYLDRLRVGASVRFISPHERLQLKQVRERWHGRLLAGPARLFLRMMTFAPFRWLAATGVNPFLVVEIEKRL